MPSTSDRYEAPDFSHIDFSLSVMTMIVTKALDIEQKAKFGKKRVALNQWFLTFYKHAEPLRSFPSFCRTPFCPI